MRARLASLSELVAQLLQNPRSFLIKVLLVATRRPWFRRKRRKLPIHLHMPIDVAPEDFLNRIVSVTPRTRKSERTRVLYFVNGCLPYTSSGYTLRTQALLRAIENSSTTVTAVTRLGYPASVGKLVGARHTVFDNVEYVHLLPLPASISRSKRADRAVELLSHMVVERSIDILHTTTDFRNASIVSRVAEKTGRPWVYEVRGEREQSIKNALHSQFPGAEAQIPAKMRIAETTAMQAANAVIALSEVSAQAITERGIDSSKIFVLPNGVQQLDSTPDPRRVRQQLGISQERVVVGAITSVVAYEGLDDLILSLDYLPSKYILLIVGSGDALSDLEQLVQERRLDERVIFAGKQPAESIHDWYVALDVFAVPRKNLEVCRRVTPIKTLQAMQLGVPIVASDLPALREVTGGFAQYVEPESPTALAAGIQRAVEEEWDSDRAERDHFLESRSWEASAQRLETLYRNLL